MTKVVDEMTKRNFWPEFKPCMDRVEAQLEEQRVLTQKLREEVCEKSLCAQPL